MKAERLQRGRLAERINADGDLTSYTWDSENRMTGAALPGSGLNTMSYDGDGKRRRYEDTGGTRIFLWDGENIVRSRQRRIRQGEQPDPRNYWLRARVYEDGIARFLSRDPAEDEVNLYRYVRNRPLVLIDPAGLQCRTPDQPCWRHRRRPGAGLYAAAMGPGGPGGGPGGPGPGMGGPPGGGTGKWPKAGPGKGGAPGGPAPGKGKRGPGKGGGGGGGGGTGPIPLRTRVRCDDNEGICCEVHPPGPGWWSNPIGIPKETWEETTCPCDEAPPNCTVVFHKDVYIRGPSDPVRKTATGRGKCVPCGVGPGDGGGGGGGGGGPTCGPVDVVNFVLGALAQTPIICAIRVVADTYQVNVPPYCPEGIMPYDYRHCFVSCEVTKQCGPLPAAAVGLLKELIDLFRAELRWVCTGWANSSLVERCFGKECVDELRWVCDLVKHAWEEGHPSLQDLLEDAEGILCGSRQDLSCRRCCCQALI